MKKSQNLLLKGIFSGIFLLLFLNTKALAEEEYIITLQADVHRLSVSTYIVKKDEVTEIERTKRLIGSLNHKGDCMRLTSAQFKNLEIKVVYREFYESITHDFYPICDSLDWQYTNEQECTSHSTNRNHKCLKYPISACGAPGNYDLVQISETPFFKMELTSEEPLNVVEQIENCESLKDPFYNKKALILIYK